jgi:uncharacterized protein (DUF302 family)
MPSHKKMNPINIGFFGLQATVHFLGMHNFFYSLVRHHTQRPSIGIIMNILRALAASVLALSASIACAADGLVSVKSPYGAKETMDRLEGIVKQRGLNVFARIDHAAGATKVGKNLRPTELLIFGNPQDGTSFMECAQTVGIDLPLKALVWQDSENQVWLSYNDPDFLAKRHAVAGCQVVANLSKALAGIAEATAAK